MKTKLLKQIRKRVDIFILDNYYYVTDYDNQRFYSHKGGFWYTKNMDYKDLIGALRFKRELILEKARGKFKRLSKQVKIYGRENK